jgi:hypothetical protein
MDTHLHQLYLTLPNHRAPQGCLIRGALHPSSTTIQPLYPKGKSEREYWNAWQSTVELLAAVWVRLVGMAPARTLAR